MATVGWIKIGMSADTSKFVKDMKKAGNSVVAFVKDTADLKGIVAGALAGLSAGALGAFVKSSMNASDATHDMARELGVSGEELAKLHHAAKVAGVDAGTLDGSLEKLNLNLGKVAQEGTGPAADALRRFGMSARQMAESGPTKAFRQSIDLLARIPNASERAAVAVELFGKSGQAMIRIAGEGKGAIAGLEAEAKALGLAISDVDSEKIGEANDALDRAWGVVQGLANSVAVELSPYLTYVADLFVDWAKEGGRAGSIVSQGIDFVTTAIGYAADAWQVLSTGFHYFEAAFAKGISFILQGLGKFADGLIYLMELIPGVTVEGVNGFTELAAAFDKAAQGELGQAEMTWNRKWAHEGVKEFVDGIQLAAQGRAQLAAGKEAAFRKGGGFESAKKPELGFGGGFELGSKESYSAILKAKGQQQNSLQDRMAADTKTTAEATTRSATALQRMAQMMDRQSGNDLGYSMSAGL